MKPIAIKRIYEDPSESDGYRILVDRLWPRGVSKIRAKLDEWDKEIAPTSDLRKWFDHKANRFTEFTTLYEAELDLKHDELHRLRDIAEQKQITLLYGAKDKKINHAIVLSKYLNQKS